MSERVKARQMAKELEDDMRKSPEIRDDAFLLGVLAGFYVIGLGVTVFNAWRLVQAYYACLVRHISTEG